MKIVPPPCAPVACTRPGDLLGSCSAEWAVVGTCGADEGVDGLPAVVGHVVGPLRAVPVAVLVLAAGIGVPGGRGRLGLGHRSEAYRRSGPVADEPGPQRRIACRGKSSRVWAPRVLLPDGAARTMVAATSARLRTSAQASRPARAVGPGLADGPACSDSTSGGRRPRRSSPSGAPSLVGRGWRRRRGRRREVPESAGTPG